MTRVWAWAGRCPAAPAAQGRGGASQAAFACSSACIQRAWLRAGGVLPLVQGVHPPIFTARRGGAERGGRVNRRGRQVWRAANRPGRRTGGAAVDGNTRVHPASWNTALCRTLPPRLHPACPGGGSAASSARGCVCVCLRPSHPHSALTWFPPRSRTGAWRSRAGCSRQRPAPGCRRAGRGRGKACNAAAAAAAATVVAAAAAAPAVSHEWARRWPPPPEHSAAEHSMLPPLSHHLSASAAQRTSARCRRPAPTATPCPPAHSAACSRTCRTRRLQTRGKGSAECDEQAAGRRRGW